MNKKIFLIIIGTLIVIGIIGYFFPTPLQITQVKTNINYQVSDKEFTTAKTLFQKNNIDMGTLAVVEVGQESRGGTFVSSNQFYKGLPIFNRGLTYHFNATGKAITIADVAGMADITETTNPFTSSDRISQIELSELNDVSLKPKISMYSAARTAARVRDGTRKNRTGMIFDYFFTGELGFFYLDPLYSPPPTGFFLAWKIEPRRDESYTYGIIDANSGKVLEEHDSYHY